MQYLLYPIALIERTAQGETTVYIVQFMDDDGKVRTGTVLVDKIAYLNTDKSVYDLVATAIERNISIKEYIQTHEAAALVDYKTLFYQKRFVLPIFPADLSHMIISGTGLTHYNSKTTRSEMSKLQGITDAEKIYLEGLNNGKPKANKPGARPEWFFKGFGQQVQATNQPLKIAHDVQGFGEEAEIAVIYMISKTGQPHRVGFALGNESSDHALEQQNHYYLAQSKLMPCSLGPELYIGDLHNVVSGTVEIKRKNKFIWRAIFNTGLSNMVHSLENIEHYLFKNAALRNPGDVHIVYLGADKISYQDDITLQSGDTVSIRSSLFNFPLINTVQAEKSKNYFTVLH